MKSIVGDTLSVEARNLVPALIDAVVSNWSELNYATRQALEDAYPVFSSWDYRFDRASVGAGPFAFWISRFYALVPKEERSFDPRSTGVTFTEREKDAATQALIETADWLSQLGYAWTTPWELFHRLRRGTIQTGSAGGLVFVAGSEATLEDVAWRGPYVRPDAQRIAAWRALVEPRAGLKVGLVWAGNPANWGDRKRSLSLGVLAPLARVPGATFHSLQVGPAAAEAAGKKSAKGNSHPG